MTEFQLSPERIDREQKACLERERSERAECRADAVVKGSPAFDPPDDLAPTTIGELFSWLVKSEDASKPLSYWVAKKIDGFDMIRLHCPESLISSARIYKLCRDVAAKAGLPMSDVWAMGTGRVAEFLRTNTPA